MTMSDFSFFTTLQAGWLNAWIPSFGMVLIQFIYMAIFREGGKRAVDTSWYTAKDKANASVSTILQIAILVLSVFVPFKFGTAWFLAGMAVYVLSLALFVRAFHSYVATPAGKTIKGGVYRWSRNPMYFFFFTGMFGVCIASASLWMLLVMIPFIIATHFLILGEERYCEETYGEEYREYKAKTPRYFLFF
ncbi:methyltransferase family protein [Tannerella forsythia]|uniref:methyltransferase family protein n=1 Tax=Tannerella forsythia TaxID=28112 RepID=UPI002432196B|nr:isoprenylcysteine carboxylmethyltransferase family protein [Tannerella forsythia]